jgi:hypothetical protein
LKVFFTVDVEVWCDGWDDIDRKFAAAFQRYVYGTTPRGEYGLPYKIRLLNDHGLKGVFFVESLFASRFGCNALAEIVELLANGKQEVQLHVHTEWVDESIEPILAGEREKRQHLSQFSRDEQTALIAAGAKLLHQAGARNFNAFRAGNFALNEHTLAAVAANGIPIDCSYDASMSGPTSGLLPGRLLVDTHGCGAVTEYPMTVFQDGTGRLRHTQLTACSFREMEGLLWQALDRGQDSFVILSHNFELLTQKKDRPDDIVVERFRRLCAFLDRNRDAFQVCGFKGLNGHAESTRVKPLTSPIWKTGQWILEQAYRRTYA